jgi:hypothetical protein
MAFKAHSDCAHRRASAHAGARCLNEPSQLTKPHSSTALQCGGLHVGMTQENGAKQ